MSFATGHMPAELHAQLQAHFQMQASQIQTSIQRILEQAFRDAPPDTQSEVLRERARVAEFDRPAADDAKEDETCVVCKSNVPAAIIAGASGASMSGVPFPDRKGGAEACRAGFLASWLCTESLG